MIFLCSRAENYLKFSNWKSSTASYSRGTIKTYFGTISGYERYNFAHKTYQLTAARGKLTLPWAGPGTKDCSNQILQANSVGSALQRTLSHRISLYVLVKPKPNSVKNVYESDKRPGFTKHWVQFLHLTEYSKTSVELNSNISLTWAWTIASYITHT